jgi:hypothetical protein
MLAKSIDCRFEVGGLRFVFRLRCQKIYHRMLDFPVPGIFELSVVPYLSLVSCFVSARCQRNRWTLGFCVKVAGIFELHFVKLVSLDVGFCRTAIFIFKSFGFPALFVVETVDFRCRACEDEEEGVE